MSNLLQHSSSPSDHHNKSKTEYFKSQSNQKFFHMKKLTCTLALKSIMVITHVMSQKVKIIIIIIIFLKADDNVIKKMLTIYGDSTFLLLL